MSCAAPNLGLAHRTNAGPLLVASTSPILGARGQVGQGYAEESVSRHCGMVAIVYVNVEKNPHKTPCGSLKKYDVSADLIECTVHRNAE